MAPQTNHTSHGNHRTGANGDRIGPQSDGLGDVGTVFDPAINAAATMTLALPKEGLRARGVNTHVGELYLADIGVPPELYAEPALDLHVPHLFAQNDIIRLQ